MSADIVAMPILRRHRESPVARAKAIDAFIDFMIVNPEFAALVDPLSRVIAEMPFASDHES
jgi:hypothetical protein